MKLISIYLLVPVLQGVISRSDNQPLNIGETTQQTLPQEPEQLSHMPSSSPEKAESNPQVCQCVPYYLCPNEKITTENVGLIDPMCVVSYDLCDHYLDVCCMEPVKTPITSKPNVKSGCGHRNSEGASRFPDYEAQLGEFPWMVAVLKEETVNDSPQKLSTYQCGGSLIHPQVVLTAAHCVIKTAFGQLKVRVGEWDTQTEKELYPHQDMTVKIIQVHENFDRRVLVNDVALLILSEPVKLAYNVNPVCLPLQNESFSNVNCYVTGWGKDVFGQEGRYEVKLRKTYLPIISNSECEESLRKTRLGSEFNLDDSFICTGGAKGRDTCMGHDGGSPLVCPVRNTEDQYVQAGITAWGVGCLDTPRVYVNIARFRNWIDEKMKYLNLDINTYQY